MLNLNNLNTGYKNDDNNFVISSNYDLLNTDNINVRWDQNKILITRPYGLSNLSKIQFRDFNGELLPFTSLQLPKLKADVMVIQNESNALSKVEFYGIDNFYTPKDYEYTTQKNVIFTIEKDWTYNEDKENQIINNIQELLKLIEIRMDTWWKVENILSLGDNPNKSINDKQLITTLNKPLIYGFHPLAMCLQKTSIYLIGSGGALTQIPSTNFNRVVAYSCNDDCTLIYAVESNGSIIRCTISLPGTSEADVVLYENGSTNIQHDIFHDGPKSFSSCYANDGMYKLCVCEIPNSDYKNERTTVHYYLRDTYNKTTKASNTLDINFYTQFTHGFITLNAHCLGCAVVEEGGDAFSVIMLLGISSYNNPDQMRFFVIKHKVGDDNRTFTTLGYSKSYITLSYWNSWKYGNFMQTQYGNNNYLNLQEYGELYGNEFYAIDLGGLVCYGNCLMDSQTNKPYFLFTFPVGYHYLRKFNDDMFFTLKEYNGAMYWGPIHKNDYPSPRNYNIIKGNPSEMSIISEDINVIPYSLYNAVGVVYTEGQNMYSNGGLMDIEAQKTPLEIVAYKHDGNTMPLHHAVSGDNPSINNFNFDSEITEQDGILSGWIRGSQIKFQGSRMLVGVRIYTEPFTFEISTGIDWDNNLKTTIGGIKENINFISLSPKTLLTLEMLILLQYEFNDVELKVSGFQNTDNIIFHINETSRVRFKEMTCSDTLTQLIITLTDQKGEQLDKDSLKAIYGKLNLSIDWVQ